MSHRTSAEEEMLKMGADAMAVGVEYASFSGSHEVKIKKYRQHERWQKEILLDGARVRPKEHYGALNAVMFHRRTCSWSRASLHYDDASLICRLPRRTLYTTICC